MGASKFKYKAVMRLIRGHGTRKVEAPGNWDATAAHIPTTSHTVAPRRRGREIQNRRYQPLCPIIAYFDRDDELSVMYGVLLGKIGKASGMHFNIVIPGSDHDIPLGWRGLSGFCIRWLCWHVWWGKPLHSPMSISIRGMRRSHTGNEPHRTLVVLRSKFPNT
mgnify:CR=1 FL=1